MHLQESDKVRALTLRECGWSQERVAADLGVHKRTIQRLETNAKKLKKGEIPQRKVGSGPKRTFGKKQILAIHEAIDSTPGLTASQVKLQLPKVLAGVAPWTIRRIILEELDIPSRVPPKKPFVTDALIERRLAWASAHSKWRKKRWEAFLFSDETLFHTKPTTGGRRVRRPRGANRFDPKYTVQTVKHPEHILFWGGICASGKRVYYMLKPKENMNSVRYVSALRRAVKLLKEENLTLVHDNARVHISKFTTSFLTKEKVKSKLIPGNSPDMMPIENVWGRMKTILENRPTRNIPELMKEVRKVWRELPNDYMRDVCLSMPSRMKKVINNNGYPTKY